MELPGLKVLKGQWARLVLRDPKAQRELQTVSGDCLIHDQGQQELIRLFREQTS